MTKDEWRIECYEHDDCMNSCNKNGHRITIKYRNEKCDQVMEQGIGNMIAMTMTNRYNTITVLNQFHSGVLY